MTVPLMPDMELQDLVFALGFLLWSESMLFFVDENIYSVPSYARIM